MLKPGPMQCCRRQTCQNILDVMNHMLSILPSSIAPLIVFYSMAIPMAAFSEGDPTHKLYRAAVPPGSVPLDMDSSECT
jgi:hypothetical protein